jgi:ABC-type transport system involved in multi-copper enzyme maturation permease subunit
MKLVPANFGLPLLTKELLEQAARRRTYVFRTVYACLLFLVVSWAFQEGLSIARGSPFAVLGQGRSLFRTLMELQFLGIFLFMPALTCDAITHEKERDTLALLFLTRLGPWTILFEKLLSRLIPMFTFMLLSLPLLALTYSMGGITRGDVAEGIVQLSLTILQVGTLSLACSAYYRTTAGAFVATYLWGLLFLTCASSGLQSMLRSGASSFFPLLIFAVIWNTVCLFLAKNFLVRRAFAPPRNLLLKFFKELDLFFTELNDNPVTRGIVLVHESTGLPGDEPIAWREATKKSLGTVRYLVRVFVTLEVPVALLCTPVLGPSYVTGSRFSRMLCVLWSLALLMVVVHAASLISGERTHQTLDVLLTTPLGGREILRQKFRSVWRLIAVLSVPFATIFYFKASMMRADVGFFLTASVLSVAIYLPLFAWIAVWIGLKSRTQMRAMLTAIGVIVGWCVVPLFGYFEVFGVFWGQKGPVMFLGLLSPATSVLAHDANDVHQFPGGPWGFVLVNFLFYGACLAGIRWHCLTVAERMLGPGRNASRALPQHVPAGVIAWGESS